MFVPPVLHAIWLVSLYKDFLIYFVFIELRYFAIQGAKYRCNVITTANSYDSTLFLTAFQLEFAG